MRHQDLVINHILESWTYANALARTTATGFVSADIGRISYQTDTGTYWRLTATTPTWARLSGSFASLQTGILTPTAPTSVVNPGVMMGFGSTAAITPTVTGKILANATANMWNSIATGCNTKMVWGTGTAPANGVPATGTAVGGPAQQGGTWGAGQVVPIGLVGLVSGLTTGTPIWFDLQLYTAAGGTANLSSVAFSLLEVP